MPDKVPRTKNDAYIYSTQAFLVIFNMAVFAIFWYLYYNYQVFTFYSRPGYVVVVIVYVVAYFNLALFHNAFKFGKYPTPRLIFNNILAIGTTDIMLYIGGCLFKNGYMDVKPGLAMAAIQVIVSSVAVVLCERSIAKSDEEENKENERTK